MSLIQLNKNGGLRLNGKKAKRASRKSLAAAAGAIGVNTTKKVQKTVEEKLTKNELIAALRNKSTGTWTKKHGGGRKAYVSNTPVANIGRYLNEVRARKAAAVMERTLREEKNIRERVARQTARSYRRVMAKAKANGIAKRKAERQAKKLKAEKDLANRRASRINRLRASVESVLTKKRSWTNRDLRVLRGNLAKAATVKNIRNVRKAANAFKKKYQLKAKKVAQGSLNPPPPPAPKKANNAPVALRRSRRARRQAKR